MSVTKKVITQDTEVEMIDNHASIKSTADMLRMRDTDGDGRNDFIDSNGYTKSSELYMRLSPSQYERIRDSGYPADCKQSKDGNYILRYSQEQKEEIDNIIKPVLHYSKRK